MINRTLLRLIAFSGALLVAVSGYAQVACTRSGLESAVNLYIAAQGKGDPSGMPLAPGLAYIENMEITDIESGIIQEPLKIDFHRSLIDTAACQTFTEVFVTDKSHPYVIGTRLRVNDNKIAEIESMVTDEDDWLFDASAYLKWVEPEDWGLIPPAERDTRETLIAAANGYLDAFAEKNLELAPWGHPCHRTEGGQVHTGKGLPSDGCEEGVPEGVNIVARRYVADVARGSIVMFCTFGVGGLPDTHMFRLENGKLRYVHTLTVVPEGVELNAGGEDESEDEP